jgi:hypothetical protein
MIRSDSKQSSIHRSSSTASDDDSTGKKTSSSPREDKSSSSKPSSSTNDGSESLSLLPELESTIKNKVESYPKMLSAASRITLLSFFLFLK